MELVAAILCRIGKCATIASITDIARGDSIAEATLSCLVVLKIVFGLELAASFARFGSVRGAVTANPAAAVSR
jgi:hypothetical protein